MQDGKLGPEEADGLVKVALEAGIDPFDMSDVYANGRSAAMLGQALRTLGLVSGDVIKVASDMSEGRNRRGSRRHVFGACQTSPTRPGIDPLDLYRVHAFDPATPIEETLGARHARPRRPRP